MLVFSLGRSNSIQISVPRISRVLHMALLAYIIKAGGYSTREFVAVVIFKKGVFKKCWILNVVYYLPHNTFKASVKKTYQGKNEIT